MAKFDRYLLSQLLALFGFFSLVLVLVYWVNRAVVLLDRLIANGHSAIVFLEFSALTLPNVVRVVLPISAFAAAVYVANRMKSESEMVVVQSAGFSPLRLTRPVIFFGVFCAAVTLVLTNVLVPLSSGRLAERTAEIAEDVTAGLLSDGVFLHPGDGVTFYIAEITPDTELRGVFLSDARSSERRVTYTAERALLVRSDDGPRLVMFDGMVQTLTNDDMRLATTRFDDFAFDIAGLVDVPDESRRDLAELRTDELFAAAPALQEETGADRAEMIFEGHDRITKGLTALVAPILGFSVMLLGGFSRFGAWRQVLGAICGLIGVELLNNLAADTVLGNAALWPVAYLPVLAGLAAAMLILMIAGSPRRRSRGLPA